MIDVSVTQIELPSDFSVTIPYHIHWKKYVVSIMCGSYGDSMETVWKVIVFIEIFMVKLI